MDIESPNADLKKVNKKKYLNILHSRRFELGIIRQLLFLFHLSGDVNRANVFLKKRANDILLIQ